MKITVVINGEEDIKPITKIFDYDKSNEFIFFNTVEIIKNKISKNLRLNINETLLLFSAFILSSLNHKESEKIIQEKSTNVLLHHQVLIGVPELLKKLTFSVTTDYFSDKISIESPILPDSRIHNLY